jgi:protein TonB
MVQIITLVLWVACLIVGLLGMWLTKPPIAPPTPPAKKPEPPLQAEVLKVELEPTVLPPQAAPDPSLPAPPVDQPPAAPPPLPEVAAPSAAMAFAQPIEGAVRLVPLNRANPARLSIVAAPVIQRLTYGLGEGRQPEPDYPQEAVDAGQQGVVGVRFKVDTDGRVVAAQIILPSPWPLLNQSALRAVRETWHFGPGPPRLYDVSITFHLNQT